VLWGFFHGAMLSIHRAYRETRPQASRSRAATFAAWLAMQYCVLLSWIAFRVTDFHNMTIAMRKFVFFDFDLAVTNLGLAALSFAFTITILTVFCVLHVLSWRRGDLDVRIARLPLLVRVTLCILIGISF